MVTLIQHSKGHNKGLYNSNGAELLPKQGFGKHSMCLDALMVLELFSSLYGSQWNLLLELLCRAAALGNGVLTVVFNLLHRVGISGMEMDPGVLCRGHKGLQRERKGTRLCLRGRGGALLRAGSG